MATVTSNDLMMMRQAAINWLKANSKQNPNIRVAGHLEPGVIHITLHGVKLDFEASLKMMGALNEVKPEGSKIKLSFPDNHAGTVTPMAMSVDDD